MPASYTTLKNEDYGLIHIDDLDDTIKDKIRTSLSKICHGISKSTTDRALYSYKETLKEFIKRYNLKTEDTKKGMIGELLSHIFILDVFPNFKTVSPYFNLEERSIKKGFDLVLYSQESNDIWITEVKSGEQHKNKTSNKTNKVLLDKAKNDLKERLNEDNSTLWENAINGATISLEKYSDMKDAVNHILGDISDSVVKKEQTSDDKNVVLISSLFTSLSDRIVESSVQECHTKYIDDKIFNNVLILSIQKATYQKVIDFLVEESADP